MAVPARAPDFVALHPTSTLPAPRRAGNSLSAAALRWGALGLVLTLLAGMTLLAGLLLEGVARAAGLAAGFGGIAGGVALARIAPRQVHAPVRQALAAARSIAERAHPVTNAVPAGRTPVERAGDVFVACGIHAVQG